MQASDETLFTQSGMRELETVVRPNRVGIINLCWRKLDRKSKKLTFNFQVANMNSHQPAGQDTLEFLNQELSQI